MLVYGFTGTQQPSRAGALAIPYTLARLTEPNLVITGGCIGADAIIGRWYADFTQADQIVVLPASLKKVSLWFQEYPHIQIERMPDGTDYMDRNDRMAEIIGHWHQNAEVDVRTFAFPKEAAEQRRSGTWATVRRFRKVGVPPSLYPLSHWRGQDA